MKVTILQTNIEWGSPQQNIANVQRLVEQTPVSDLYVLPEMWSTGFATEPEGIAEHESSSISLEWMIQTAKERKCAISGSLAIFEESDNGKIYRNRHYFVNGENGVVSYYDKHHLFTYGRENVFYQPGEKHTIVTWKGFKLLLLTCYDLRFPLWSRYSNEVQFDGIICVANWPESRQNAWHILTRARAIENQAYLIAVNRVGYDSLCHYSGRSSIISPIGNTLAQCQSNIQDTASYILNYESLVYKREKFRVLEDRDIK